MDYFKIENGSSKRAANDFGVSLQSESNVCRMLVASSTDYTNFAQSEFQPVESLSKATTHHRLESNSK